MLNSRSFKGMLLAFILVTSLVVGLNNSLGFLSESDSNPPPSSGTYTYSGGSSPGTFMPGETGFPAAGGTYTEPVFGETVRRISASYPTSDGRHVSYSGKLCINADSTKVMLVQPSAGTFHIHRISDGVLLQPSPSGFNPTNENWQWHPTDPNKALFLAGSSLKEYNYSTNSSATIKTFSGSVANGGEGEFADRTGRYYVFLGGTTLQFYDRTEDVIYSNSPTGISLGGGGIYIAPDGSGVVATASTTRWYSVNHATNSWNAGSKVLFNSPAHSDLVQDAAGRIWVVAEGSAITSVGGTGIDNTNGILAIPVDNPYSGYKIILGDTSWVRQHHISGNISGANADWVCISSWDSDNPLSSTTPWTPWRAWKEEIFLINVRNTLDGNNPICKRLAHHRGRNVTDSNYYWMPKACLSVDGTLVVFNSNMGRTNQGNYVDAYTVTTGLGKGTVPPSPPLNLRIIP